MKDLPARAERPLAIKHFEIVFIGAMAFYVMIPVAMRHLMAAGDSRVLAGLIGAMLLAQFATVILISRRRRNWARWLIIVLLVLDVPMYMAVMPKAVLHEVTFYALGALQFVLHFRAVFLLFTPEASAWLGEQGRDGSVRLTGRPYAGRSNPTPSSRRRSGR